MSRRDPPRPGSIKFTQESSAYMNKLSIVRILGAMLLALALNAPSFAQSAASNKTFGVTVQTSFGSTFTDCFGNNIVD
jgi:hypothetical protein